MFVSKSFEIIFKRKHLKKWQIVFWLNAALLLYLTLMPSVHHNVSYQNIDKLFHFVGFGAFAFFCVLAFPRLAFFWTITISFSMGIGVEVAQSFLPYRGFSYADMFADFAGIIAAVGFLWIGKGILLRQAQVTSSEESLCSGAREI